MDFFIENNTHHTAIYLCDSCSNALPCVLTTHDEDFEPCSCPFSDDIKTMKPNWRKLSPKLDKPNVGEKNAD